MGSQELKKTNKAIIDWIVFALIIAFFYNGYIFLNTNGNEHPLVSSLFTMLIILFALFILHHKDQLKEDEGNFLRQTHLEQYFKKINFKNK